MKDLEKVLRPLFVFALAVVGLGGQAKWQSGCRANSAVVDHLHCLEISPANNNMMIVYNT